MKNCFTRIEFFILNSLFKKDIHFRYAVIFPLN